MNSGALQNRNPMVQLESRGALSLIALRFISDLLLPNTGRVAQLAEQLTLNQ
jgi:hypothetical protein